MCTIKWGLVRHKTVKGIRMDVLIFSAATAAILHCYSDGFGKHRDVFASKCALLESAIQPCTAGEVLCVAAVAGGQL